MPPPRAPSRIDSITFPVFCLSWSGVSHTRPDSHDFPVSIVAHCGGGGSARTGVGNSIVVQITSGPSALCPDKYLVKKEKLTIDTGEQICVGVALYQNMMPPPGVPQFARLLAAVGDEVLLYDIPISAADSVASRLPEDASALLLGRWQTGKAYGCNAVAFSPDGAAIAVGCENGLVLTCALVNEKPIDAAPSGERVQFQPLAECKGHEKAVCAVAFHPRGIHVLSSAKDGTARVWDAKQSREAFCVLNCSIEDPNPPKNQPAKRPGGKRKPQQILVRGCAYGDLEGKVVYTVQSGRRSAAFLSHWKLQPAKRTAQPPLQPGEVPPPFVPAPPSYSESSRHRCSAVPVSAMSLSGDASTMALGGVDGTITLLNVENMEPAKSFMEVHDLPVTGIAARPVPISLPGDADEGVSFDAISASADNKLAYLTTQRKAKKRRRAPGPGDVEKGGFGTGFFMFWLWTIAIFALMLFVARESYDYCREEIAMFDVNAIWGCVVHGVLWADPGRPGIMVPPY